MGYYIRILTPTDGAVSPTKLRGILDSMGMGFNLELDSGGDEEWETLLLSHKDGVGISLIERNAVTPGSIGEEEIDEFLEEIEDCKPVSAIEWLKGYLTVVRAIYAFQILFEGAERDNGWDAIDALYEGIRKALGGIMQADLEGFFNEDGNQILWQFGDNAKGHRDMAVMDSTGRWVSFQMDLGNKKHRKAFLAGKVPKGTKAT